METNTVTVKISLVLKKGFDFLNFRKFIFAILTRNLRRLNELFILVNEKYTSLSTGN